MEPECLRLKGELLLAEASAEQGEAERLLRQSIALAQAHKAKSWELRAATSLAGLCQSTGRRAEARAVLSPIYDWFTEGFDTVDLRQAKTLLEALG
jgi:predicted ATPase